MSHWLRQLDVPIDHEILEESALAMAQSAIQNAINQAGISRADLARKMGRPRSFISLMLSGSHNLTVKTMSRALAACGFEIRFQRVPIVWNWKTHVAVQSEESLPVQTGSTMPTELPVGVVLPVCLQQIGG